MAVAVAPMPFTPRQAPMPCTPRFRPDAQDPAWTIVVTPDSADGDLGRALGVTLTTHDFQEEYLTVDRIEETGVLFAWNLRAAVMTRVQVGDRLVEVNGVRGSKALFDKLGDIRQGTGSYRLTFERK